MSPSPTPRTQFHEQGSCSCSRHRSSSAIFQGTHLSPFHVRDHRARAQPEEPLGIAIQYFQAPAEPAGMQALLERSVQSYGPLPSDLRPRTLLPERTRILTAILDDSNSSNRPPRPTAARTTPLLLCWASSYHLRKPHTWDLTRHGCYQRPRPFRSLPHSAAQRNSRRTSSSPGNQIDEQLKAERWALKKQNYTVRVLLLGQPESGSRELPR
ncbi:hypothetical protein BDZ97DRAFT_1918219 [Flammula alnicola]|nr:hypothetical protein BDZ97DRAFT_1918219 [Flammula alnicola]